MKYKILQDSPLFDKLKALQKRMTNVKRQAEKVAKSFNGTGRFCGHIHALAGGISAIEFDEKPEGWKAVGESWQRLYYPKVINKEANKLIAPLPLMDYDELNKLVNFKSGAYTNAGGIFWIKCPEINFYPTYTLINIPDGVSYTPVDHMIEILDSEFQKLNKRKTHNEKR